MLPHKPIIQSMMFSHIHAMDPQRLINYINKHMLRRFGYKSYKLSVFFLLSARKTIKIWFQIFANMLRCTRFAITQTPLTLLLLLCICINAENNILFVGLFLCCILLKTNKCNLMRVMWQQQQQQQKKNIFATAAWWLYGFAGGYFVRFCPWICLRCKGLDGCFIIIKNCTCGSVWLVGLEIERKKANKC